MKPFTLWVALLACSLRMAGDVGVQSDPALLDAEDSFVDLPQASGQYPPTPLTTSQEERILNAVFMRFPEADPVAVMAFIREHFKRESQRFTLMSMQHLRPAMEYLIHLVNEALVLMDVREQDPGRFANMMSLRAMEAQAATLAEQAQRGDATQQAALVEQLESVLTDMFTMKQRLMKSDIEGMSRQLAELRALVAQREANQEAIIRRRLNEITTESDVLLW